MATTTLPVPTMRRMPTPPALPIPITPAALLREAPDNDTAVRWMLAWYMELSGDLDATIAALQAQIVALQQPTMPRRPIQWRPQIVTLLTERGAPMTAQAITQALDAPQSLARNCREMVQAGLLVQSGEHFTLPPDPTVAANNGTAPRRGGRAKKAPA
jgi:hypothetical protein